MRIQQDNWKRIAPSKRRKGGAAFVREVALDNLQAMCERISTSERQFTIGSLGNLRISTNKSHDLSVYLKEADELLVIKFKCVASSWTDDNVAPPFNVHIFMQLQAKYESLRARFEPLLTCPTLWRDSRKAKNAWLSHAETRALNGPMSVKDSMISEGRVYCSTCLDKNVTRYVRQMDADHPTIYVHDSNDGDELDKKHFATPSDKWYDTCTYCDCPGGNHGPPPDPDAPKPPMPMLEGQDLKSIIDPEALLKMRDGGTWYAYQNEDLSSGSAGHLQFLKCGEGCTFTRPPNNAPDSKFGLGWRYLYYGAVNTVTGLIIENKKNLVRFGLSYHIGAYSSMTQPLTRDIEAINEQDAMRKLLAERPEAVNITATKLK